MAAMTRAPRSETLAALGVAALLAVLVLLPVYSVATRSLADSGGVNLRFIEGVLSSTRIISNTLYVGV